MKTYFENTIHTQFRYDKGYGLNIKLADLQN